MHDGRFGKHVKNSEVYQAWILHASVALTAYKLGFIHLQSEHNKINHV